MSFSWRQAAVSKISLEAAIIVLLSVSVGRIAPEAAVGEIDVILLLVIVFQALKLAVLDILERIVGLHADDILLPCYVKIKDSPSIAMARKGDT